MLKLVDTVRTTCSKEDFIRACSKAWYNIYNVLPDKPQIGVLYAQNALETGNTYNMYNWNIGNVKAVDVDGEVIEYCMLKNVWEIVGGKKVTYQPPHRATWFRSFKSLTDGVTHHFNFLRNKRYKIAWTAVEQGDPVQFAKLLKKQGYYTAPEADYINAMQYHFKRFMKDDTFDNIKFELLKEINKIEFPPDYKPVSEKIFDMIEDQVEKKDKMSIKEPVSLWHKLIGKFIKK